MLLGIRKKYHRVLLLGVFFLVTSLLLLIYNWYNYFKVTKKEDVKIDNFLNSIIGDEINVINTNDEVQVDNKVNNDNVNVYDEARANYILVLEIPDIKLKKGLVDFDSKYNDVRYNIQIIDGFNYPDVDNGNLILAAHNGSDYYAYFRNLSSLEIGDSIYVYYNGIKYQYVLDNVYDIKKDGEAEIWRNANKTTITLITCMDNTDDRQVVYIGYLVEKTTYN